MSAELKPTKRIKATMPEEMITAISEFQRRNGIQSWAQAMCGLINRGLISEGIPPIIGVQWGGDRRKPQK